MAFRSEVAPVPVDKKQINSVSPEEWVTIEGKVVALGNSPSPSIAYSGIIADASGAIRFVVWAKASVPEIKKDSWYRLESAVVDEFKGALSLKVHSGTTVKELDGRRGFNPCYDTNCRD